MLPARFFVPDTFNELFPPMHESAIGHQRRRRVRPPDAAHVHRSGEGSEVLHHAAAQRDDRATAGQSVIAELAQDAVDLEEVLVLLVGVYEDRWHGRILDPRLRRTGRRG